MNSFWNTEADFFDEEDDFYCFSCLGDEASLDIFIDKETLDSSYALILGDEYVIGDKNNHVSEDVILTKGNEFLESVIGEYATLTKDQIMEMTYSASSQVTSEFNDLGTDTRTGMPWDQTEDMDWDENEKLDESVINERIGNDFTAVWGNHLTNIARVLWSIYTEGDQFDRANNFGNSLVYGRIFSDLQYEGFITKRRNGGKFIYSLTPFGMKQIERIKKAMDAKHIPYDEPRSNVKNEPAPKENNSSTKIIPFEQCFLAELILDAEDYQGPRECCWIKPSDLNEVLRTYVTPDEEENLNINDLKEKYEKAKNKILNGETKYGCMRMRVGEDYGEISSSCVPDLKHYLSSWPGGTRDSRTQRETTLWMCVAPSRDFFKFNDDSWSNYPVVPAKKPEGN